MLAEAAPAKAPAKPAAPAKKQEPKKEEAPKTTVVNPNASTYVAPNEEVDTNYDRPGTKPFGNIWGPEIAYSDQLANGKTLDDLELEDEDDPSDPIADDDGFVHQWKIDPAHIKEWGRRPQVVNFVQTSQDPIALPQEKEKSHFSDELADGNDNDDIEVDDLNNDADDEVDENMMIQTGEEGFGIGRSDPAPGWGQIMAQVNSKQAADSLY